MKNASNFVTGADTAFYVILGISAFFLVAISTAMVWFLIKYNKKRHPKPVDVKDNIKLEMTWIIVPLILVMVMFYYGWIGYQPMRQVPDNSIPVIATGRMWSWSFEYPNGKASNTLVVPLGKPVLLNLVSEDVVHSLFVPAFRIKEDVVPNKKNFMWFTAEEIGSYDIYCTEYCGVRHAYMISKVEVKSVEEYTTWYNSTEKAEESIDPIGLQIMKTNGCIACHSIDGTKLVGPSLKGLYGSTHDVETDGKTRSVTVDDEHLKKSLFEPNADVYTGYGPIMPHYKEKINDEDIKEIIKYLQTIK